MTEQHDPALRALTYLRNEGWCSDDPATTEYNLAVVRGALAAAEAAPLDVDAVLLGMVQTSWPMNRTEYEKGWNEAIHAARAALVATSHETEA